MMRTKKIIAIIIVTFLLFLVGVQTKASDNPLGLNSLPIISGNDTNAIMANQIEANQIQANRIAANQVFANAIEANKIAANSQVVQPTVNKTNTTGSTNDTLPQTGVTEDITVMFFIIVCVVSALYAYKKIRDYNI